MIRDKGNDYRIDGFALQHFLHVSCADATSGERFFVTGCRQNDACWAVTHALSTKCQYKSSYCAVREGRDDEGVNKENI